jgi:PKHD-type hydroxylase
VIVFEGEILDKVEVEKIITFASTQNFLDGKRTAGGVAQEVKYNREMERPADLGLVDEVIFDALRRNERFQASVLPLRILLPIVSRYTEGMEYGLHVDAAVMGGEPPVRTDLAMTIFLSEPSTYDGGELVIQLPTGEKSIKHRAGDAIVYSAATLHRVSQVTRGFRLAAITWIQSWIRDDQLRRILSDLTEATESAQRLGHDQLAAQLRRTLQNLLRCSVEL